MAADFSRRTFDPRKHYSGVLMQQGRVQLDSDWNEQLDIGRHRTETETRDIIGRSGTPLGDGFRIGIAPGGTDLTIAAGRFYVDGLLCEFEKGTTYTTQPDYPDPEFTVQLASPPLIHPSSPPTSPPLSAPRLATRLVLPDGVYIVFLDAWQQEITWLDDARLRETALGGPDTAARSKTAWQVRLLKTDFGEAEPSCDTSASDWDKLVKQPSGRLNARTTPVDDTKDPCLLPPGSGYRRLENQLYRIEVQQGGARALVTFKWSRDNGSVTTAIESFDPDGLTLIVADVGKDEVLGFAGDQWVEVTDDATAVNATPRPLAQIASVDPVRRKIGLRAPVTAIPAGRHPKLRRWDQTGTAAGPNGLAAAAAEWVPIEDGIEVRFADGSYRAGDYWLVPARTNTGEIEWPPFAVPNTQPEEQPPVGVRHHFCRLALLRVTHGVPAVLQDCRKQFPALTDLTRFFYLGGDGQGGAPGRALPHPLRVGVARGAIPVVGATVRFSVAAGGGSLQGVDGAGRVATDAEGVASCVWVIGQGADQQVVAELVDRTPGPPQIHFGTGMIPDEPGVHIKVVIVDNRPLENDTEVSLALIAKGISIVCDDEIEPDTVKNRPTCFVTIEMPILDAQVVVASELLVLAADIGVERVAEIVWRPPETTIRWVSGRLAQLSEVRVTRVLARLTAKGNFIWSGRDPNHFLDGEVFGTRRQGDPREPTRLRLPSGNGRRGGDFEMWFYVTR